jgi:hypothetical protein
MHGFADRLAGVVDVDQQLEREFEARPLKDGQTGQFTSAIDKLTGETVKVDVTLTVVK